LRLLAPIIGQHTCGHPSGVKDVVGVSALIGMRLHHL
jgi:hypothetical protein